MGRQRVNKCRAAERLPVVSVPQSFPPCRANPCGLGKPIPHHASQSHFPSGTDTFLEIIWCLEALPKVYPFVYATKAPLLPYERMTPPASSTRQLFFPHILLWICYIPLNKFSLPAFLCLFVLNSFIKPRQEPDIKPRTSIPHNTYRFWNVNIKSRSLTINFTLTHNRCFGFGFFFFLLF